VKNFKINEINVFDYGGELTPLIFIHGFPLSSRMWNEQVSFFKDKFRIITYDVRGLSGSSVDNNLFTMETLVNDFFNILDYFKIEKADVCGLSMGGYISLRTLTKNPERFNTIILADTRAERDDNEGLLNRSQAITDIQSGKRKEFTENFIKKLVNEENYKSKKLTGFLREMMNEQSVDGICGAMIAIATRTNTLEDLPGVNVPALILIGEEDELTPFHYSENIHKALKNSVLKSIPHSGHMSNIENPDFFNKTVYDFLKEHPMN
jgi:pimeloyl-ACP methyl ester carboxylesterase